MKKILLVLIALMGIGFSANAQSCEVGDDSYVAVKAWVNRDSQIECNATWHGLNAPTSGTVYVTVYYVDTNGNEESAMISIYWDRLSGNYLQGPNATWKGADKNVARIKRWEVSAGACRIKKD